jgi:hypothetical protein
MVMVPFWSTQTFSTIVSKDLTLVGKGRRLDPIDGFLKVVQQGGVTLSV